MDFASKRSFLFDLDGTLIDSSGLHERAFRCALASHAPQILPRFDYEWAKGRRTSDVFVRLTGANGELAARLTSEKQRAYLSLLNQERLPVIAGARKILTALSTLGRRLYLVSAGSRTSVGRALHAAGLRTFFAGVVTSDDVSVSKPSPDIYLRCLAQYSLEPGQCLTVEDSESGLRASLAASIDCVVVHSTQLHPGALGVFRNLDELLNAICGAPSPAYVA
jgi:HAD superfamily hydrolase (TIGR01509 family)